MPDSLKAGGTTDQYKEDVISRWGRWIVSVEGQLHDIPMLLSEQSTHSYACIIHHGPDMWGVIITDGKPELKKIR